MNMKPFNNAVLKTIPVLLVLLSAACAGGGPPATPLEVNLSAEDIKYNPTTISAKLNQPVTVNFQNKGSLAHSFVIDSLSVNLETIQGGQAGTVSFTPTTAGAYEYYCDVPGHKEAGMVGTLTVNP